MRSDAITILCSGTGLGVYVPGLILEVRLADLGFRTNVVVLEELMTDEGRRGAQEIKVAFHQSFFAALASQRLLRDIRPRLDTSRVEDLLSAWRREKRRAFIVLSGFWIPILEAYGRRVKDAALHIDLVHMDASLAPSWRLYRTRHPAFRHVWFFHWQRKVLRYRLPTAHDPPRPFAARSDRYLIHGGGWGVGTYRKYLPTLAALGLKLDVVLYQYEEAEHMKEPHRYFLIDPSWEPWKKDERGRHQFPPLGEVRSGKPVVFRSSERVPEIYRLVQQDRAIIAKPGGATLLDSLSACTPVVLLDPFGPHEERNALLWQSRGFGISYQDWLASGCSGDTLRSLHENLVRARRRLQVYQGLRADAVVPPRDPHEYCGARSSRCSRAVSVRGPGA